MKIHLLRSSRYDKQDFTKVVQFLTSFEGPIEFQPSEPLDEVEDIEALMQQVDRKDFYTQLHADYMRFEEKVTIPRERLVTSWHQLFDRCERYRIEFNIPPEDMVVLLTPVANEKNWFAAVDPIKNNNAFVHTGEWAHYVRCPDTFPVAYLVITQVLHRLMFRDWADATAAVHHSPLGCFNDFCQHKKEIILKLRTADICYDCMEVLKEKADPLLVQQALNIFEAVRLRILFAQNFRQSVKPSRLVISRQNRIFLSDYGNIEILLTPLEKTLYLFFLRHSEGMMLHDLVDYREELRSLYSLVTSTGVLSNIMVSVNGLTDVRSNSASEKISKIKKAFTKAVGKELAEHYIIKGLNGERKSIALDRQLVIQQ